MAGDVRFLEQRQSGDSAAVEMMPLRLGGGMKIHALNQAREQGARIAIGQRGGITRVCLHNPLAA